MHYWYWIYRYLSRDLSVLGSLSTTITGKVDHTHYNLLSSLSQLSSTISILSKLYTSVQTLRSTFAASTAFISQDIASQASAHTMDFDAQAFYLTTLEQRISKGRESMNAILDRLEAVKTKIRFCEELEGARGRKQKGFIVGAAMCLGLLLATFLASDFVPASLSLSDGGRGDVRPLARIWHWVSATKHSFALDAEYSPSELSPTTFESRKRRHLGDDPRLGLFDELWMLLMLRKDTWCSTGPTVSKPDVRFVFLTQEILRICWSHVTKGTVDGRKLLPWEAFFYRTPHLTTSELCSSSPSFLNGRLFYDACAALFFHSALSLPLQLDVQWWSRPSSIKC